MCLLEELFAFGSERNHLCLVLKRTFATNLSTIENKTCGRVSCHCWTRMPLGAWGHHFNHWDTCLRNRKHVPCFYRVIQTRMEVWENEKCCGNTSRRRVFPQLFQILPNFHECLHNSIETRSTCFLFLLVNNTTKKKENTLKILIIKMYFLFARDITTSTARASSVSPSSYTNKIFNQSARVLS